LFKGFVLVAWLGTGIAALLMPVTGCATTQADRAGRMDRGQAFGVWREPFTELRVPLLFHLRRDPFEKAQHNSNTYNDWFLDRPYIIVPMQQFAAHFYKTMQEYPPSQTPGSFNLEKVQKMIEAAASGK
jgi:arylsulfatase